jgi:O-antigen/teichoic acid export membrane protein
MTIQRIIKRISARFSSYDDIVKNIGIVFSANAIVAILGLCTLMVFTHSVGVIGLGLLALIEVYPRLVDQVVRFEPSQAVIRYGTAAVTKGDDRALFKLIKWATIFDFCGAAIAAILALTTLHFANYWLKLSPTDLQMANIFAATLFFFVSATSVSVMRLLGRFDLYAKTLVLAAFLRFGAAVILWWIDAPFVAFFWLIVVDALLQHIIPFVISWRLLFRKMDTSIRSIPIKGVIDENPGILRFIFNANANVLARNSTKQFDIFLLAGLVGQAEIGLYQLAKRVAMSALRVSKPIQTVVFPKLTQLWESGEKDQLVKLVIKFNFILACIGVPIILLFLLWGDFFIGVLFGAEFKDARPLMAIQLTASTILMSTSIFNATLLSTNQDRELLLVTLCSSSVFLLGILVFVPSFGIIAASWLTLAMNIIWALGCGYFFMRITRSKNRP